MIWQKQDFRNGRIGLRRLDAIAENARLQRAFSSEKTPLLRLPVAIRVDGLLAPSNAMAHQHPEQLAALDPLTNIYDRRFGLGRLDEEFSRARRSQTPLGLIMFDIDYFKRVNDTYGHLTGDRVIRAVARTAADLVREGDVTVRYGGEEFMVILPGADQEHTCVIAERIRHTLETHPCDGGGHDIPVTLSLGVASFPQNPADQPSRLIHVADLALYRGKDEGRNRVVRAPCESAPGPASAVA